MDDRLVLAGVPPIAGLEHSGIFTNALAVALKCEDPGTGDDPGWGLFDALSGLTGRGWLIGWGDAAYGDETVSRRPLHAGVDDTAPGSG